MSAHTPSSEPVDPYRTPESRVVESDAPSDAELRAFAGPNSDHYLRRCRKFSAGGSPLSRPLVPALLFTALWCFYRRMYLVGFGVAMIGGVFANLFAIPAALVLRQEGLASPWFWTLSAVGNLTVPLVFATLADYVYYRRAVRRIEAIRERARAGEPTTVLLERIRAAGGTRFFWVGLFLLLCVAGFVSALLLIALKIFEKGGSVG